MSEINSGKTLKTVGWLIVLVWGLREAAAFFVPLCIAGLLAFLITPFVTQLRKRRVPEWVALTLSAVGMLLPFAAIIYGIVTEAQNLARDFPTILASIQKTIAHLSAQPWAEKLGISSKIPDLESLTSKLGSSAGKGLAMLVGGLTLLLDASSQMVLVLIFAILMVASRVHLRRSAEHILAEMHEIDLPALLDEVTDLIQRFLVVRLLITVIVGAADAITLRAFGINYALLLGAAAGVLTMLPNIGFFVALVPILAVSLATGHSGGAILAMLAVLVVISFIEGNVLSPKLVGQRLNINTLSSFVGFFAGGLLWGVWGMLLSVPALGILRIVFSKIPRLQGWGELLEDKSEKNSSGRAELPKKAA